MQSIAVSSASSGKNAETTLEIHLSPSLHLSYRRTEASSCQPRLTGRRERGADAVHRPEERARIERVRFSLLLPVLLLLPPPPLLLLLPPPPLLKFRPMGSSR